MERSALSSARATQETLKARRKRQTLISTEDNKFAAWRRSFRGQDQAFEVSDGLPQAVFERYCRLPAKQVFRFRNIRAPLAGIVFGQRLEFQLEIRPHQTPDALGKFEDGQLHGI